MTMAELANRRPRATVTLGLAAALALLAGCQVTQMTEPRSLTDFRAEPTDLGVEISFTLRDEAGRTTVLLFGSGVLRIEEPPSDSSAPPTATVDTSRILYNRQLVLSREFFVTSTVRTDSATLRTHVCHLGTFPYRQFDRAPRRSDAIVRLAVVSGKGNRVLQDSLRVRWPDEVLKNRGIFGSRKPFAGGG